MRNLGRGVIVGAAFLAACGGGTKNADTTSAAAPAAGQPAAGASASASAPAGGAAAGTGTAQAATGKTWEVKMVGDASGYKFDPANLTIKEGDAVKWTVVGGSRLGRAGAMRTVVIVMNAMIARCRATLSAAPPARR